MTAQSTSAVMYTGTAPLAPSNLTATAQSGPQVVLQFLDNAIDEAGFTVERAVNGGAWAVLTTLPARAGTGNVTYTDTTVLVGSTYDYRVRADKGALWSAWSNTASATISVPTSINVTAPGTGGTYNRNSTLAVAWTPNRATVIGEFGLWIRNADGSSWLLDKTVAANGSASYTNSVTLAVPTGTDSASPSPGVRRSGVAPGACTATAPPPVSPS